MEKKEEKSRGSKTLAATRLSRKLEFSKDSGKGENLLTLGCIIYDGVV